MDAEIKAKWLDALRSGQYQQGQDALQRITKQGEHCYCCLGVLCDLVNSNGWGEPRKANEGFVVDYNAFTAFPPGHILDLVGLTHADINGSDEAGELATMNDHGQSFAEIADYIETHL